MRYPWGALVRNPQPPRQGVPAAYDWRDTRYEWRSTLDQGRRLALDVERLDTPQPEGLVSSGWTKVAFLTAWTRAEVLCKLLGIPILCWVKMNGLSPVSLGQAMRANEPRDIECWTLSGICESDSIAYTCGFALRDRTSSDCPRPAHTRLLGSALADSGDHFRGGREHD